MKKHPLISWILLCIIIFFSSFFLYMFGILPLEVVVPILGCAIILAPVVAVVIIFRGIIKKGNKKFDDKMALKEASLSKDEMYALDKVKDASNSLIISSAILGSIFLFIGICLVSVGEYSASYVVLGITAFIAIFLFSGIYMKKHPEKYMNLYKPKYYHTSVKIDNFKDKTEWYFDSARDAYCMKNRIERNNITEKDEEKIWEYAGLHIAYFIQWLIEHDYFVPYDDADLKYINDVKNRKVKPTEILTSYCDERLIEDDISKEIIDFVKEYYQEEYFNDFENFITNELKKELFLVKFSYKDYDKFKKYIDEEYYMYLDSK